MLSCTEARASSRRDSRCHASAFRVSRSAAGLLTLLASGIALACSEGNTDPLAGGSGTAGSGGSAGQTGTAGTGGSTATAGTSSGGTGGSGTSGTGGSGGSAPVGDPLISYDFEEDIEAWYFAFADPASLIPPQPMGDAGVAPAPAEGVATAAHDAAGDPSGNPGSIRLELPFSGPAQKISYEVGLATGDTGVNLAARRISVRISVVSGYSTDPMNPPGLKLYAKTGATSLYADSGYINIAPGADWQTFSWSNVSSPTYVDPAGTYEPTDVRQIGIEFDTGSAGVYAPATILLDTVAIY